MRFRGTPRERAQRATPVMARAHASVAPLVKMISCARAKPRRDFAPRPLNGFGCQATRAVWRMRVGELSRPERRHRLHHARIARRGRKTVEINPLAGRFKGHEPVRSSHRLGLNLGVLG